MKITAIIIALNEAEFIRPCVSAIYNFVDRIRIQTNYDRSWAGQRVAPDETVKSVLEIPDEAGKISLSITRIPDEAIARNWLMRQDGYNLNHRHHTTTSSVQDIQSFCQKSDYFWVIDADEIYDPLTIPRIIEYLKAHQPRILKIRGITYFKSWNYKISPSDDFFQPGFIRPGVFFQENRWIFPPDWMRLVRNKYWNFGPAGARLINAADRARGVYSLPEEVGVFHHASYIGDDARMLKKYIYNTHYPQMMKDWFESVWKKWTPEAKNLHPVCPDMFKGTEFVDSGKLPDNIKNYSWPPGYIAR